MLGPQAEKLIRATRTKVQKLWIETIRFFIFLILKVKNGFVNGENFEGCGREEMLVFL